MSRIAALAGVALVLTGCIVSGDVAALENEARGMRLADGERLRTLSSHEGGMLGGAHASATILATYPAALDAASLARGQANILGIDGWSVQTLTTNRIEAARAATRVICETGVPHAADAPAGTRDDDTLMRCVLTRA